jgi:hypothetical protein
VTVDDIAEMLRQARVREPWYAPEIGCYSLAQCINNPLGYRSMTSAGKTISKKRLGHDPGVMTENPPERKPIGRETQLMSCAGRCQAPSRNLRAVLRNHSECTHRHLPEPSTCERSKIFLWPPDYNRAAFKEAVSFPPLNYRKRGSTIDLSFWRAPERLIRRTR